MKHRILKSFLLYISLLIAAMFTGYQGWAQNRTAVDSIKAANQHRADSIRAVQKARTDSLALIRNYKASKQYKDSVAAVRQSRMDSIADVRAQAMEALRAQRKQEQDSIRAITIARNDSLRNINDSLRAIRVAEAEQLRQERKRVSDSLGLIRAYKQSPRFKDSVAAVNKLRLDSIKAVRVAYNDSVRAAQRHILDSMSADRKRTADSMRAAQVAYNDSLKAERLRVSDSMRTALDVIRTENARIRDSAVAARKVISDSLAKVRAERVKEREEKVKEKEKKKQLAFEMKIESEKKAYTNERFRKKRWTAPRKVIQNTFTRYNYYFNANLKMKEAEENMRRVKRDNFDMLITLFPFNPDVDSARLKSDMDTIIQKTSMGIQLHDPRGKWQDDLYMIMGQAYYYKGDYENAANAFKFVIHEAEKARKEKLKKDKDAKKDPLAQNAFAELEPEGLAAILRHSPSKNEAILWLARVFVKQKEITKAVLVLDMLKNDINFPKHLRSRLALEYANVALETDKPNDALEPLREVLLAKDMDKYTRTRAGYLRGQILQEQHLYEASTESFEKVIDLFPRLEMDFSARMNIVKNNLEAGTGTETIYRTLAKMARDQKFRSYFDQVYYGLGKHYEHTGDTEEALKNYNKSIEYSENNALQKGTTYVGIGDLYYNKGEHLTASQKYDSAVQFLTRLDEPYYTHASTRSGSLYQIAAPATQVKNADSLLYLNALSEPEQRAYIQKYLKDLEKRSIDSYYVSLKAPVQPPAASQGSGNKSWYFANTTLMQKGANEFKQKWPNRELKDNWRRSNLSGSGMSVNEQIVTEHLTPEEQIRKNLPDADSLYLAIPRTARAVDSLQDLRQKALYSLGKGYFYNLEDYTNTFKTFDKLDSLYPRNEYIPETYYIKYLIRMRQQQPEDAGRYYDYLVANFPDNNWTVMMTNAATGSKDTGLSIDKHYTYAYDLIMSGDYTTGLKQVEQAYSRFSVMGNYKKQYDILRVIGYAGKLEFSRAETLVDDWLNNYKNDSLYSYATTLKAFIVKNKNIVSDSLTQTGKAGNNAIDTAGAKGDIQAGDGGGTVDDKNELFSRPTGTSKYYALLVLPLDGRIQGIKAGLSEYNRVTAGNESIVVTLNALTQEQSIVLSREFASEKEARKYINKVRSLSSLFSEYDDKNVIQAVTISVENYPKLLASKDVKAYVAFWKKYYK